MAVECPCNDALQSKAPAFGYGFATSVSAGESQQDCPKCEGQGFFYYGSQRITAGFTNARSNIERFSAWGEYARAMACFTTQPEHMLNYLDRVTIVDAHILFRDHATRTSETIESLRYPVKIREHDLEAGVTPVGVMVAWKADSLRKAMVDGLMQEGVDFVVTPDGKIDWARGDARGTAPAEGQRYTMSYYTNPVYVVLSMPHSLRVTKLKHKEPVEHTHFYSVQSEACLEFIAPVTR